MTNTPEDLRDKLNKIFKMVKDYPNNMELGKKIRSYHMKLQDENLEETNKRIKYLKTELAHERFHDGWVVSSMKKELKELENNTE